MGDWLRKMKNEKSYATSCLELQNMLNTHMAIIGVNQLIVVDAITQWKIWFRFEYFEMDADARQSLKWFTMNTHGLHNYVCSHAIWYEDWI